MPPHDERPDPTPAPFAGAHRMLIGIACAVFVWLLVECAVLLPGLIGRYGWH